MVPNKRNDTLFIDEEPCYTLLHSSISNIRLKPYSDFVSDKYGTTVVIDLNHNRK